MDLKSIRMCRSILRDARLQNTNILLHSSMCASSNTYIDVIVHVT